MVNKNSSEKSQEPIRINRFLAQCGLGSRRKCDELIRSGRLFVNGEKVVELGMRVRPDVDQVEYMGKALRPIKVLQYWAYFKPREVMVTRHDPQGRTTIYDALKRDGLDADLLKYVGRLDYNSEGLLLLTNDGDMIHALTHPRFKIKKVYLVRTGRAMNDQEIARLLSGVESEGQVLHAAEVKAVQIKEGQFWYEISLFEGKNRQIRRMLETVGHEVRRLRRIQFGTVRLGAMKTGSYRELTPREIGGLMNAGFKK
ncbi:MAG: pseudouridine synthase [Chitinispirillaceae bacterium]